MSNFLRPVDYNLVDFFVRKTEGICYCIDEFLKDSPYLLCHRYLHGFLGDFPENRPDCLVIGEPSGNGEEVILYGAYCGGCYLGSKRPALALAESKIGLAVLKKLM